MKKFFLIPLVALFTCVNVWATDPIARIIVEGGEGYTDVTSFSALNEAIENLSAPATITLLRNIVVPDETDDTEQVTLHIFPGKNVTLNLAGFGIKQDWALRTGAGECTYAIKGSYTVSELVEWYGMALSDPPTQEELAVAYSKSYYMAYAGITLPGSNFISQECESVADINDNAIIYNQGTLRIISEGNSIVQMAIDGGTKVDKAATICNAGDMTIEGGIFIGPNGEYDLPKCPVIWTKEEDRTLKTTILGGTFLCYEEISDYNKGADLGPITGPGTWVIKGGIFSTDEMVGVISSHKSTKDYYLTDRGGTVDYSPDDDYEAIEVPYSNANIKGYNSWRTDPENPKHVNFQEDGVTEVVMVGNEKEDGANYQHYRYAVKPVCVVVPKDREIVSSDKSLSGTVTGLEVQAGKTLTIAQGTTLKVGAGGIAIGGKDDEGNLAKIVIEKGATLISDNDIITGYHGNVELTMDEVNQLHSNLLIKAEKIQGSHPNATVKLISKAKNDGELWQRFAVPTYVENFKFDTIKYDKTIYPTAFLQWGTTDWEVILPAAKSTTNAVPFKGYILTTSNANQGAEYTFKCELVGNGNPSLTINAGWNYFANSYTAPMNIKAWLTDLMAGGAIDVEDLVDANLWVQNPKSNRWKPYSFGDVQRNKIPATAALQPMQAFVYHAQGESGTTYSNPLKYTEYVYEPFFAANSNLAPRRASQEIDFVAADIILTDENGDEDEISLLEGERFSSEFDNGYDVMKLMDEGYFNIYLVSPLGNLSTLASDDINNAAISVKTADASEFTISFANVTLENCFLVDVETEIKTEIKEGNTYVFTGEADTEYSGRFVIVKEDGEDPSAIDNVNTKHITNGIYSITGSYMGTNLEVLPAGIYVVNGKKVVK